MIVVHILIIFHGFIAVFTYFSYLCNGGAIYWAAIPIEVKNYNDELFYRKNSETTLAS